MRTVIRRLGNSQGVSIPKRVLEEVGLAVHSPIDISVDGARIIIRGVQSAREGWAADAAQASFDADDADWLDADLDRESRSELRW